MTSTQPAVSSSSIPRTAPRRAPDELAYPPGLVLLLTMLVAFAVIVAFVFFLASRMPV